MVGFDRQTSAFLSTLIPNIESLCSMSHITMGWTQVMSRNKREADNRPFAWSLLYILCTCSFPAPIHFFFFFLVSVCCHYCHVLRLPFRTAFSFSVNSVNYSNAFTGFKHCQPFFLHVLIHSVHGLYLRTCLLKMYACFCLSHSVHLKSQLELCAVSAV